MKIEDFGKPIALAYLKQDINYSQEGWIETVHRPSSDHWLVFFENSKLLV